VRRGGRGRNYQFIIFEAKVKEGEITRLTRDNDIAKQNLADSEATLSKTKDELAKAQAAPAETASTQDPMAETVTAQACPAQDSTAQAVSASDSLKEANPEFFNQLSTLTANLTAVTEENDQLKNKLEQAEKTLAALQPQTTPPTPARRPDTSRWKLEAGMWISCRSPPTSSTAQKARGYFSPRSPGARFHLSMAAARSGEAAPAPRTSLGRSAGPDFLLSLRIRWLSCIRDEWL
jgi:hypothetical protein